MKTRKILSFALCLLMILALLCACTVTKTPDDPGETDDPKPTHIMDSFAGESFYFSGGWFFPKTKRDYTEEELENLEGPIQFSPIDQAQADRAVDLENKYDVKLVYASDSSLSGADLAMALAAGEEKLDVFHNQIDVSRDWYLGGAVADLADVSEYIDLTDYDKWGSPMTQMTCTYQGIQWGVPWHASRYAPCPYICYGQLLVNLETFEQFETDWTFQELDETEQWTFDKMLEILPEISDNTDYKNQIFGFQYTPQFAICAVYANGGDKVVWDEAKGKYVYGLTSDKANNAIYWAGEVCRSEDYANCDTSVTPFLNGKSVIHMPNPNRVWGDIYTVTTDVCFIPFPYGPDVEYGSTYTTYYNYNDSATGLYETGDLNRKKASAFLWNELTEELAIGTNEETYLQWLFHNRFGKDDGDDTTQAYSYNVYCNNGLNIRWSYCLELGSLETSITNAIGQLVIKDASTVVEKLSTFEDQVNNTLDATINP